MRRTRVCEGGKVESVVAEDLPMGGQRFMQFVKGPGKSQLLTVELEFGLPDLALVRQRHWTS